MKTVGRLGHDAAGGDAFRVELQQVPRDKHSTGVIFARQKILRLLRQVALPPHAIATIASECEERAQSA